MKHRIIVFAVVVSLAAPWLAMSCSCIETSLQEALDAYDAVFVGKVIRLEFLRNQEGIDIVRATLKPLEVVKGAVPSEVEFVVSNGCCYCDYWFDIAETYLIFARSNGNSWDTDACSRSGKIKDVANDLKALGLERLIPPQR